MRVCRVGAKVEIRVPAPFSHMAMCHDHKQTIGRDQIDHWTESAVEYWLGLNWTKKLKLVDESFARGPAFDFWKRMLPRATDREIFMYCNDACHENRWVFTVVGR
jgi:hypothetical protein